MKYPKTLVSDYREHRNDDDDDDEEEEILG